jgi:2-polyprenyl-3-methyl-5-hydroxy-6-metoxy-1,4-benzoquinol methylase
MTEHDRPKTSVRAGFSREDWNRRYAEKQLLWSAEPNACFAAAVAELEPGRALDVACGEGRNAVWLAQRGWRVTALDFSDVALAKAERLAAGRHVDVDWVLADVRDYEPSRRAFDLVGILYLQLPAEERRLVLRWAEDAVAPDGTLIVLGHDATNIADGYGGPKQPEVLFTAEDVAADLSELVVERAERVRRRVPLEGGEAVAIDALVQARRPATPH